MAIDGDGEGDTEKYAKKITISLAESPQCTIKIYFPAEIFLIGLPLTFPYLS